MHFTSLTYLAFLPLVLMTYRPLPSRRLQNWLLLTASYVFYGWWDYRFCLLMLVSSLVDFAVGALLQRTDRGSDVDRFRWKSVTVRHLSAGRSTRWCSG